MRWRAPMFRRPSRRRADVSCCATATRFMRRRAVSWLSGTLSPIICRNQLVEHREHPGTFEVQDLRRAGQGDTGPNAGADRGRDERRALGGRPGLIVTLDDVDIGGQGREPGLVRVEDLLPIAVPAASAHGLVNGANVVNSDPMRIAFAGQRVIASRL